jgi:CheY-like chemotaxis protein
MTDPPQPRPRSRVLGRVWADLPLRVKGLVVVAIPLLALLLATALFGVALAQDRRAQGAVLHTVEVERQIAQVRILVQAGVTGYVLTGERRYRTSYEAARQELPRSIAHLGELVSDNPGQVDRVAKVEAIADRQARVLQALVANVRADRPPRTRVGLIDRNKETTDALVAQLQAMQDTEQRLLRLVERVLSRRPGVRLISAMRPQLGLDLAADHHPDLVLLDLHLPDMPGEAVLRRLQASPRTAGIPVVILSADARPGLVQRLLEQGARGFLTKPLDVKELLEVLDGIAAEREQAGHP